MKFQFRLVCVFVAVASLSSLARLAPAADLQLILPLGRHAYQTNEVIDLAAVRSGSTSLSSGELALVVSGEDGSQLNFRFPLAAVPVEGHDAKATVHLHLNGWLLRPGKYLLAATADGATATAKIEVYSHIRKSTFRLIDWGSTAKGPDQAVLGEDSLGFNLLYAQGTGDDSIVGGLDFTGNCVMSGGHQMDLRSECDWSDPAVLSGARSRVVRAALEYRTNPNAIGVHFYDEPGLTWMPDPVTKTSSPHSIPSQLRSFTSEFGHPPISFRDVRADNPADVARWTKRAYWKLGLLDAAWKDAQFGVSTVRPDFLSLNQSQYGFSAFTDGYYFNVTRSLPVASGHGGYDDFGPGYFNPSYFLEIARARDYNRPCWYLPTWYGNTPSDRYRLEQNLSFITNIQGMCKPPDMQVQHPTTTLSAEGIVETNKTMARLGTIYTTMPVTRPPVAILFSLSDMVHNQSRDMNANYAHETTHGRNLPLVYLAGKLIQQPLMTVVDEDIVDGTLAANHKAVVLVSIDYLAPAVISNLEDFASHGGLVLTTSDCKVRIAGAIDLGATPTMPDAAAIQKLMDAKKYLDLAPYTSLAKQFEAARPIAAALKRQFHKAGISPVFDSDNPGIVASRQALGDIEYLFAVNATYDEQTGGLLGIKPAEATIKLPVDHAADVMVEFLQPQPVRLPGPGGNRAVYDAMHGGPVAEFADKSGPKSGHFRFGPGEMRVFARTARPIGGVQIAPSLLERNYTAAAEPLVLNVTATLVDAQQHLLCGSAPLEIRLLDPFGETRYALYRATSAGVCQLRLPLAANDPAGTWKLIIRELLGNHEASAPFELAVPPQSGAVAGTTSRAAIFGNDREHIFKFFRNHKQVTIVKGSSPFNDAAAARLAEILIPWGVQSKIVTAADVNKPREVSVAEAPTLSGIEYTGHDQIKPGAANPAELVGYDVAGPAILLGSPDDNPLIRTLVKRKVLPYAVTADFPGRNRGLLAWQLDIIRPGEESIAVVATDAAGLGEGIGGLYEAAAGEEPLTRWDLPSRNSVVPANQPTTSVVELSPAWQVVLPDRAAWLRPQANGSILAYSLDGTLTTLTNSGQVDGQRPATNEEAAIAKPPYGDAKNIAADKLVPHRIVKWVATDQGLTAIAYWGGTLQILADHGATKFQQMLSQDVAALGWSGDKLIVGLADGRVMAFELKH
jgi:hypothetical protein